MWSGPRGAIGGVHVDRCGPRHDTPLRVSERRLVSVLFADLVGFTTLAEDRDPEDVRELLTRYFEMARDDHRALRRDASRSSSATPSWPSWGTPTAHEDDAERAVRAGLELVDAVRGARRSPTTSRRAPAS